MIVFTFAGYCDYIEDIDYDYVIVDKTFNNCTNVKLKNPIYHETNTDDRYLRIALQLKKVLEVANYVRDDIITIIDSDLIIPNLRKVDPKNEILSPCYYAYWKGHDKIDVWCYGTNFIFRKQFLGYIDYILNIYLTFYPNVQREIDVFLHYYLPISRIIIPGTQHYIKTKDGALIKTIEKEDLEKAKKYFGNVRIYE